MITIVSAFLCLALAQQPASTVLDRQYLPELGLATLSAEGPRVNVRLEKDGTTKDFAFEVPGGRVLEARSGPWLGGEMIVVLSVQEGQTTSYRYALSAFAHLKDRMFESSIFEHFADPDRLWFLTNPLFTSTGEPFRIVAVNDHHPQGDDSLEITFRRGWIKRIEDAAKIEEKILFDSCGGYIAEPLQLRLAVLLERGGPAR